LPPGGRAEPAFAALREIAQRRGVAIEERAAGDPALWIGDIEVQPIGPPRSARAASRNDGSLVLRVRVNGRVVLLPGDLELAGEQRLLRGGMPLAADLLKLGHHGSRTSSGAALLRAAAPALAIVSAPLHGRFGMPHAESVARLAARRIPWCWTGRDGALLVGLGPALTLRAFAAGAPRSHSGARSDACSSRILSSSSSPAGSTASPSRPRAAPPSR
jgi:competence protein ComEC